MCINRIHAWKEFTAAVFFESDAFQSSELNYPSLIVHFLIRRWYPGAGSVAMVFVINLRLSSHHFFRMAGRGASVSLKCGPHWFYFVGFHGAHGDAAVGALADLLLPAS